MQLKRDLLGHNLFSDDRIFPLFFIFCELRYVVFVVYWILNLKLSCLVRGSCDSFAQCHKDLPLVQLYLSTV